MEEKQPEALVMEIGDEEDEVVPVASSIVVRSDTEEDFEEVVPMSAPRKQALEPIEITDDSEDLAPAPKPPTRKITLKVNRETGASSRPKRQTTRAAKRRVPSPAESEARSSESEPSRPSRSKRAKKVAVPATTTRSLRSRASKTEAQLKEEEDVKARIRQAIASDDDFSEE